VPDFAPALKVRLAPRCALVLSGPTIPATVNSATGLTILASVRGAPPISYQWLRNGQPIADGPDGAAPGGGTVAGSSGTISVAADQTPLALTIAEIKRNAAGQYTLQLTGACGTITSSAVSLTVCIADFNNSGVVSVQDIFDFLSAYFGNDPATDVNGSGSVSVQDIFDYLAAYFAGC